MQAYRKIGADVREALFEVRHAIRHHWASYWSKRIGGQLLFEGDALAGLTPIFVEGRYREQVAMAQELTMLTGCVVFIEVASSYQFPGNGSRLWVPKAQAEVLKRIIASGII